MSFKSQMSKEPILRQIVIKILIKLNPVVITSTVCDKNDIYFIEMF